MAGRDRGLESLRGLLILCVVLGHLPLSLMPGADTGPWTYRGWVYAFHVPAFLALSCLFVPAWDWKWMGRRALLLLLPYLFWLARPTLFFDPIGDLRRLYEAQKALPYGNWAWDKSVLWFLPALLACNAVVALLLRLPRAAAWGLALGAWLLLRLNYAQVAQWHVAGKVPYSLDAALYFAPLFLAARELARRRPLPGGPWVWAGIFMGGVLLVQFFEPVKTHSEYALRVDLAQFSVPVSALGILGCAAAVLGLLAAFAGREGSAWLAWLGARSMPIYLMHYYFLTWGARHGLPPLALLALGLAAPCAISWAARRLTPYARYFGMEA